ncbi:MAG: phage holin family protein [Formosimonas sp.]|jgi:putative membrane protein
MTRWLILWAINAVSLMALPYFLNGIRIESWAPAIIAAVALGFFNSILKPILQVLTFPIQILTLGLFTWVINGAFMMLLGNIIHGFTVDGFWTAILASIVYSLISWAGATVLLPSKKTD